MANARSRAVLSHWSVRATGEPPTVKEVVTGAINLIFHATLMAAAGDSAMAVQ